MQVTVEATLEHPFFVFGQGWSSCSPERTLQRYELSCHRLTVGDVCISLTHKDVTAAQGSRSRSGLGDQPRGATDFSTARLLCSTPRSRDLSDYPHDLSLHRSVQATPMTTPAPSIGRSQSSEMSRPIRQQRWSTSDLGPARSCTTNTCNTSRSGIDHTGGHVLSLSPLIPLNTSLTLSTTSRSIVAPPSTGSAEAEEESATSSSRYSSPTRGHSPISVGREPTVTSSGPGSPP